ncbi:MAG: hypothetical protein E5299_01812 [Burkholderia gladioli]|nr:MAG: hypothetical protein E5299_01812 [Burkholderia gladioli]
MSSAVTVPTTPSHAMRPLLHAVLFLRFRHARVPLIGQRICPVRRGVMARLMQLPVTVVENGSNTVATTGDRLPKMRCIGSRRSQEKLSRGASHRLAGNRSRRSRQRYQRYMSVINHTWWTRLVQNPFLSPETMSVNAHCIFALDLCKTPHRPRAPRGGGYLRLAVFGAVTGDRMARNLAFDRVNRTGNSKQ